MSMGLFRNKDMRRICLIMLIVSVLGSACCFFFDVRAGIVCTAAVLLISAVYLADISLRYRRMGKLAADIDAVLQGNDRISLDDYNEGEFSILRCEITKLTVRLREQAELLMQDKRQLADSIADISHQIRTPLTTLNLIAAALREQDCSPDKRTELILEMRRQLSRVDWLISALLKLSRLDADAVTMRHERFDFSTLIRHAAEPLAIPMELKNQTLRLSVEGGMTGDLSWTAEAIGNIMKNCTEHMNEGTLYVTTSENPLYSEVIIRDTGAGIEKDDLPHLFERFYRGKNSSEQSVGIGLALSRMIVTKQNGTIKAENHKSGGAVFTVRFYNVTV